MQLVFIQGSISRQDPVSKTTKSGKPMTVFTIASSTGYGQYRQTDYFNCVCFGKLSEVILKKFHKHDQIQVMGEFHNKPYRKDENGYEIPNWQFTVNQFWFPPMGKGVNPEGGAANTYDSDFKPAESSFSFATSSDDDFITIEDSSDLQF